MLLEFFNHNKSVKPFDITYCFYYNTTKNVQPNLALSCSKPQFPPTGPG